MIKRIGLAACLLLSALAIAAPASAGWWSADGRWHPDNRWYGWNDRYYYGYYYRAPPVVYATPYNYGYYSPPVIYDSTPGFSITIRP
jgi:hypothetical protein